MFGALALDRGVMRAPTGPTVRAHLAQTGWPGICRATLDFVNAFVQAPTTSSIAVLVWASNSAVTPVPVLVARATKELLAPFTVTLV